MLGRPISSWIVAAIAAFTLVATRGTIVHASTLGDPTATVLISAILASGVLALVPSRWAAVAILAWVAIDAGMSVVWMYGSPAYMLAKLAGLAVRAVALLACAYHVWTTLTARTS